MAILLLGGLPVLIDGLPVEIDIVSDDEWILATGYWNDSGIWIDSDVWID